MDYTDLKGTDEANEALILLFEGLLENLKNVRTHEEKVKIIKDFNMMQFNAENCSLGGKKVKDYPEYHKAKDLLKDFFHWTEKQRGINIFKVTTEDPIFNEIQSNKTYLIAELIQTLPLVAVNVKAYLILNIYRTTYELNFKNMVLILEECRKKQGKKLYGHYFLNTLFDDFKDYSRISELREYFKNDIRNPIAHESWFVKNDWVWMEVDGQAKQIDLSEISKQIYELYYFRVALATYMLGAYGDFVKDLHLTPQNIADLETRFRNKIKELKGNK